MKKMFDKLPQNQLIDDLEISLRNKQLIDNLLEHLTGYVTDVRLNKYKYALTRFAYLVEKDFDKLTYEEIRKAGGIVNNGNLAVKTKQDIISEIKTAFKFWFGKNQFFPESVGGLKALTSKEKLRLPDEMPTEEDIYRMIKACGNSRDQFFIALLGLDGALRPIEARKLVWGDCKKDKHGHFVIVKTAKKSGDKDTRVVRLIKSEPYFIKWNQDYPAEKKDNALIFVNFSDLKPISAGTIASLFKRLSKKLELKRMYPYLLRHQLVTRMSKDPRVPIAVLKKFIGHSLASNTISEYQHFGDDDLKDMQLLINGIQKVEEKKEDERKPITCFKCGKSNEYDAEFCHFCNMALSQKRMVEIGEKQEAANKLLFMLARKELAKLKGKDRQETEDALKTIEKT